MHACYIAALGILLATSAAYADDAPAVKRARESGVVLTDGKGHYLVFLGDVKRLHTDDDLARDWSWYGDGKTFYRMIAVVGGSDGEADWRIVDERVGIDHELSSLETGAKGMRVQCEQRFTPMTLVPDADARTMLKKAVFKPRRLQNHAFAAGREGTTYYLVDAPDDMTAKTTSKARVFIGKRGAMKPLKVTSVEIDNAGTVFMTPKGAFRTTRKLFEPVTNQTTDAKYSSSWKPKTGEALPLADLDVLVNGRLIYAELGVYPAQLGVPCDDL